MITENIDNGLCMRNFFKIDDFKRKSMTLNTRAREKQKNTEPIEKDRQYFVHILKNSENFNRIPVEKTIERKTNSEI